MLLMVLLLVVLMLLALLPLSLRWDTGWLGCAVLCCDAALLCCAVLVL